MPTFAAGVGAMLLGPPLLNIVQRDVPQTEAGSAGGIIATAQRIGHALGIAVVGTTLFAVLPAGARDAAPGALADDYHVATQAAVTACLAFGVLTFLLVFVLPRTAGRPTPPAKTGASRNAGRPADAPGLRDPDNTP